MVTPQQNAPADFYDGQMHDRPADDAPVSRGQLGDNWLQRDPDGTEHSAPPLEGHGCYPQPAYDPHCGPALPLAWGHLPFEPTPSLGMLFGHSPWVVEAPHGDAPDMPLNV
jgi:hypothetical protein